MKKVTFLFQLNQLHSNVALIRAGLCHHILYIQAANH